jgi:hypothetical protein
VKISMKRCSLRGSGAFEMTHMDREVALQVSVLWLDLFKRTPPKRSLAVPTIQTPISQAMQILPKSTSSIAFGKGYQSFKGALFFADSSAKNKFLDNRTLIDDKKIKLHFKRRYVWGCLASHNTKRFPPIHIYSSRMLPAPQVEGLLV